jgi:hypothetical protein
MENAWTSATYLEGAVLDLGVFCEVEMPSGRSYLEFVS